MEINEGFIEWSVTTNFENFVAFYFLLLRILHRTEGQIMKFIYLWLNSNFSEHTNIYRKDYISHIKQ